MSIASGKLRVILWGLSKVLPLAAARYPEFAARLKEHNVVARIMARDEDIGRWFEIRDGKITSGHDMAKKADVTIAFKNATVAADLLTPVATRTR